MSKDPPEIILPGAECMIGIDISDTWRTITLVPWPTVGYVLS